jgi:hypothetical protein
MIAIVISACLVGDPGVCKSQRIPLAYDVDASRCLAEAPPHFAKWIEQHPGWQIVRWRCTSSNEADL